MTNPRNRTREIGGEVARGKAIAPIDPFRDTENDLGPGPGQNPGDPGQEEAPGLEAAEGGDLTGRRPPDEEIAHGPGAGAGPGAQSGLGEEVDQGHRAQPAGPEKEATSWSTSSDSSGRASRAKTGVRKRTDWRKRRSVNMGDTRGSSSITSQPETSTTTTRESRES